MVGVWVGDEQMSEDAARDWRRAFVAACRWFDVEQLRFLKEDHLELILQASTRWAVEPPTSIFMLKQFVRQRHQQSRSRISSAASMQGGKVEIRNLYLNWRRVFFKFQSDNVILSPNLTFEIGCGDRLLNNNGATRPVAPPSHIDFLPDIDPRTGQPFPEYSEGTLVALMTKFQKGLYRVHTTWRAPIRRIIT